MSETLKVFRVTLKRGQAQRKWVGVRAANHAEACNKAARVYGGEGWAAVVAHIESNRPVDIE